MTKPTTKQINSYIRKLADQLGLKDWTILLGEDEPQPENENTRADYTPTPTRKFSYVRFRSDMCEWPASEQRHAVIHELIHLHMVGMSEILREDLCDHLGQHLYNLAWNGYNRQRELAVDAIAASIAQWLPLPPWT